VTENARLELSAPSKMQGWKMQDWKYRHHVAGGGKCGTGIIGTKLQGWKMRHQAVYGNYLSEITM